MICAPFPDKSPGQKLPRMRHERRTRQKNHNGIRSSIVASLLLQKSPAHRNVEKNAHAMLSRRNSALSVKSKSLQSALSRLSDNSQERLLAAEYDIQSKQWRARVSELKSLRTKFLEVKSIDESRDKFSVPTSSETPVIKRQGKQQELESSLLTITTGYSNAKSTENPKLKPMLLKVRMEINKKVGQISNSKSQISSVVLDLSSLFSKCWATFGEDLLCYCLVVFAEKIIVLILIYV